jgi:hypothetical protein
VVTPHLLPILPGARATGSRCSLGQIGAAVGGQESLCRDHNYATMPRHRPLYQYSGQILGRGIAGLEKLLPLSYSAVWELRDDRMCRKIASLALRQSFVQRSVDK